MSSTQKVPTMIDCKSATVGQLKTAIQNRIPICGADSVITHMGAHIDEQLGLYFIMHTPEGKKLFPDIKKCGFMTQKELGIYCNEEGFYLLLQKFGILVIGTGKGPFDEHAERNTRNSCSDLVATYLDLRKTKDGRIVYSPILNYVNSEDRNGSRLLVEKCGQEYAQLVRPGMLANSVKNAWDLVREGLKDEAAVIEETFGFIQNEIGSQKLFLKARDEYEKAPKQIIDLQFLKTEADKKMPAMLVVESDNEKIVSVARRIFSTDQTKQPKILLKINSKGQFQLFPMNGISMKEILKLIRLKLAKKRGIKFPSWKDLTADGSLSGIEEIYYHADADSIMNGSLTQPDVEGLIGTKNGFNKDELLNLIIEALNFSFPKQFANKCTKGTCIAKVDKNAKCPYYPVGFTSCHEVRTPKVVNA